MPPIRQALIRAARHIGVLPVLERVRYLNDRARSLRMNARTRAQHPGERFPPTWLAYDAYSTCRYDRYLARGERTAHEIREIYHALLARRGETLQVLEWGCGPARILRHLARLERTSDPRVALHGTDYNAATIDWCRRAIPGVVFAVNALEPPLSYPEGAFDFLYSASVYTHLRPALQRAWLAENLRVVRSGGFLMLTVHGDETADHLSPSERRVYDTAGVVARADVPEGSRLFCTYNSPEYMKSVLLKGLPMVLDRRGEPGGIEEQHVYVVQKSG